MATFIPGNDISDAWVKAMIHLNAIGGVESNLVVAIASPTENPTVRKRLDQFFAKHASNRVCSIRRVADTIFPIDFYLPALRERTLTHLCDRQREAREMESRSSGPAYIDRLIDWPGKDKPVNQLENVLNILRRDIEMNHKNGSKYELAGIPVDEPIMGLETATELDLRVQCPGVDLATYTSIPGFPCLSHVSLTLFRGRLDLTAIYRNQHFVTKAYGNFVGLADLQRFLCNETGCQIGEIVCVATHADAEFNQNSIKSVEVKALIAECQDLDLKAEYGS